MTGPPRTHAAAAAQRLPHLPASDCPGVLARRKLRRHDSAWQCRTCAAVLWFDARGVCTLMSYRGEPLTESTPLRTSTLEIPACPTQIR